MLREITKYQEMKPRVESDLSGWKTDRSRIGRGCETAREMSEKRNAPVSFCLVRKGGIRVSRLMFSIDVADTSVLRVRL